MAMGGAGVATGGANRANPASLAFTRNIRFYTPTMGLRTGGALREVTKLDTIAKFISGSEQDKEEAADELARKFASQDSSVGLNLGIGVRMGPLEIQTNGVAQALIQPNAILKNWGAANSPGDPPTGSAADVLAAALYTLPSVGFGVKLPDKAMLIGGSVRNLSIGVGGRIKYLNSVYSRYTATYDANGDVTTTPGSELGGKDYLRRTGIASDVGGMVTWADGGATLSGGLVVTNLVKPNLSFQDKNSNAFDPVVRTVTLGASFNKGGLTVVGDIVNLTGKQEVRVGGEQKLGPFAVRAGYNSGRSDFTYGVGIFGIDIAFGKGQPLEVVQTLRF